ncbi:MAG: hypothetical protein AAB385_08175, partial [Planctomycetota bacterium]
MSDWMLRMMEKLGFTEGTSLEDKRLNKGIERAQRKVEERNFSIRKHLLEWDEPMDFQRKEFYTARQRILEERDLPELILATIDNSIATTLKQYLSGRYNRTSIVEWCRTHLDLTIDEDGLDMIDAESAQASIRKKAKDEAYDMIRTSLGEYIDPEEPPSEWDVGGLLLWARRVFKLSTLTQNQLRKMEPREIEDALCEAADALYDSVDLTGIAMYLDPQYPYRALADWARTKFNIEAELEELIERPREEITELFDRRVREAYRRREIVYPVEWCLERALAGGSADNAAAAAAIAAWTNGKFNVGWKLEDVQGRSSAELHDTLVKLNEEFFGVRLDREIEQGIAGKDRDAAIEWAKNRFGRAWNQQHFDRFNGDLKAALLAQGREMLRWELTRLEQFVLLRIYDQAWKDHLLEMDHLKTAIMQRPLGGDQTHPQSQYAIEGRDLFTQMWGRISGRVTDIVFKIRAAGGTDADGDGQADAQRGPRALAFRHADATGAGFASADQQAAMRAQGTEGKVETIRR